MEQLPILKLSPEQVQLRDIKAVYSLREWKVVKGLISPLQYSFGSKFGLWPNAGLLQQREQQIAGESPGNRWKFLVTTNKEATTTIQMERLLGHDSGYPTKHGGEEDYLKKYGPMSSEIRKIYEEAYQQGRFVDGYNTLHQWLFSLTRPYLQEMSLKYMKIEMERAYAKERWYKTWDNPEAIEVVVTAGTNWIEAVKKYWEQKASARRPYDV